MFFYPNNRDNWESRQGRKSPRNAHWKRALCAGFTLFEMMVSITIFVLLAGVLLVKNSQFEGTTVLTNLTYELALEIREAQSYGVDVEGYIDNNGDAANFSHAYGIHYDTANATDAQDFDLFIDNSDDLYYNPSGPSPDAIIDVSTLPLPYTVARISAVDSNGRFYCTDTAGSNGQISSIDIVFKRPQPSAIINAEVGVLPTSQTAMVSAAIYLKSQQGLYREIEIEPSGEISVNENPTGPSSTSWSSCSSL